MPGWETSRQHAHSKEESVVRQVLNKVKPLVDQEAVKAADLDAKQRAAAVQREEDARQQRDQAVVAGYNRAPDRGAVDDEITDPDAPQLQPDLPPPPFEAIGLDETALRTYQSYGVDLSPSTQKAADTLDTERKEQAKAARSTGGRTMRADEAERLPNDTQTTQTASSVQNAEPNQPNQPDQPSRSNEVNKPSGSSSGSKAAAAETKKR